MSGSGGKREIEIKLRVPGAEAARRLLRGAGFRVVKRRVFESNVLFDNAARELLSRKCLLRVRRAGARSTLTYKGTPSAGRHKSREELETLLASPETIEAILDRLGLRPVFRYEKYRTEFERPGQPGLATLDETPVGVFLELEGQPDWIDCAAGDLGFSEADYILLSYASIYWDACRQRGQRATNMLFGLRLPVK